MARRFMTYNTEDATPHRQLVTNSDGEWVTAERLAWKDELFDISWDGNTDGHVASSDGYCYKVSDSVFSIDEIVGAKVSVSDGYSFELNADYGILKIGDIIIANEAVFIVKTDNAEISGIVFPKKGTYFNKRNETTYITNFQRKILQPIPDEYVRRIIITFDANGTSHSCNVPYDSMSELLLAGVPVVLVAKDSVGERYVFYYDLKIVKSYSNTYFKINTPSGGYTLLYHEDGTLEYQAES